MRVQIGNEAIMSFAAVGSGNCFRYKGKVYIKTSGGTHEDINAVELESGACCLFVDDTKVGLVNAKVVVE